MMNTHKKGTRGRFGYFLATVAAFIICFVPVSCAPPDYVADFDFHVVPWTPVSVQVSLAQPGTFTISYGPQTDFSSSFESNFDGTHTMDFSTLLTIPGHQITLHMTDPRTGTVTPQFASGEIVVVQFNTTANIYINRKYEHQGNGYETIYHPESRAQFTVPSLPITIGP